MITEAKIGQKLYVVLHTIDNTLPVISLGLIKVEEINITRKEKTIFYNDLYYSYSDCYSSYVEALHGVILKSQLLKLSK